MILPRLFLWLLTLAGVSLIALMPPPVLAEEACISVADDRASAEKHGLQWLGIFPVPFTENSEIVYYRKGKVTLMSRVMGGCVEDSAHEVGVYKAETRA